MYEATSYVNFSMNYKHVSRRVVLFSSSGLILYAAQDKSAVDGVGGDFVSFGLRSGVPEFRFSLGSGGAAVIRGRKAISFGQWHSAKISRHVVIFN